MSKDRKDDLSFNRLQACNDCAAANNAANCGELPQYAEDEKVKAISEEIIKKHINAFKELAK